MGFNAMNLMRYRICGSMLNLEIQFVSMHVVRAVWKSAELKNNLCGGWCGLFFVFFLFGFIVLR